MEWLDVIQELIDYILVVIRIWIRIQHFKVILPLQYWTL